VTLIELTENGLQAYGTWNSSTGLNITRAPLNPHADNAEESIANKSFIVLIALSPPYNMLKEDSRQLTGNDRYEGFGIELIHELSLMLGFNYTFQVQEDGAYGSLDKKTKQWNGMLRRIMDGVSIKLQFEKEIMLTGRKERDTFEKLEERSSRENRENIEVVTSFFKFLFLFHLKY